MVGLPLPVHSSMDMSSVHHPPPSLSLVSSTSTAVQSHPSTHGPSQPPNPTSWGVSPSGSTIPPPSTPWGPPVAASTYHYPPPSTWGALTGPFPPTWKAQWGNPSASPSPHPWAAPSELSPTPPYIPVTFTTDEEFVAKQLMQDMLPFHGGSKADTEWPIFWTCMQSIMSLAVYSPLDGLLPDGSLDTTPDNAQNSCLLFSFLVGKLRAPAMDVVHNNPTLVSRGFKLLDHLCQICPSMPVCYLLKFSQFVHPGDESQRHPGPDCCPYMQIFCCSCCWRCPCSTSTSVHGVHEMLGQLI